MNLVWAFKWTNAIDNETKNPIPVDIDNYSKVNLLLYLMRFYEHNKADFSSIGHLHRAESFQVSDYSAKLHAHCAH